MVVAMPVAAKQQVMARIGGRLFGIWSFMPIYLAKKSAESAATVKLKEEELACGSVEGVDGDGEDGR
eukprot:2641931-Prymnesium_polylepis.1